MGARLSAIEPLSQSDRANFQTPAFQRLPRTRARVKPVLLAPIFVGRKETLMTTKLAHSAPDIPRMFFAESHASTSQECQRNAAECLRLLQTSLDSTNKAILLEMAKAWISFAEQQKAESE